MKKKVFSFGFIILTAVFISVIAHFYATLREKEQLASFSSDGETAALDTVVINSVDKQYLDVPPGMVFEGVTDNNFGWLYWDTVTSNSMAGDNDIVVQIDKAHFPDPMLRYAAFQRDENNDQKLSKKEIRDTVGFSHSFYYSEDGGIKDLTGLEYFTELKKIDLSSEPLTIINLSSFSKLRYLSVYDSNRLVTVEVSDLPALETLSLCYCGNLRSIFYGASVKELILNSLPISYISFPANSNLTSINVMECYNLVAINVSSLSELDYLNVGDCSLVTLSVGSKNTKLAHIYCESNFLTALDLRSLSSLEFLYCSNNRLQSLLLPRSDIRQLSCYGNNLELIDVYPYRYLMIAYEGSSYSYNDRTYYHGYTDNDLYCMLAVDNTTSVTAVGEVITPYCNGVAKGGVELTWNTNPHAVRYGVFRKEYGSNDDWLLLATTPSNTYLDTLAVSGTEYYYAIRGIDQNGNYISAEDTGFSYCQYYDYYPEIYVTSADKNGVTLTWDEKGGATAFYQIIRKESGTNLNTAIDVIGPPYVDESVVEGRTYTYSIYCMDYDYNCLTEDTPYQTTAKIPLLVPLTLNYDGNAVNITWNAVADAASYRVFRAAQGETAFSGLAKVTSPKYTDKKVEPGNNYTYYVRPMDSNGKYIPVDYYASEFIEIPNYEADFNLEIVKDGVKVAWEEVDGVTAYRVFRREASENEFKALSKTTKFQYVDKTAEAGKTYYYYVRCLDEESHYIGSYDSTGKSIEIPQNLEAEFNLEQVSNGVRVYWEAVDGASAYRVFRREASENAFTVLTKTTKLQYVDKTTERGKTYYYYVRCLDENLHYIGTYDSFGKSIEIPVNVEFKVEQVSNGVRVYWEAEDGVSAYRVFRREASENDFTALAKTTKLQYVDKTTEAGKTYSYYVRCLDENLHYIGTYDPVGKSIEIPQNVEAEFNLEQVSNGVRVYWEAVDGVSAYRVFRREASENVFTALAKTAKLQYVDKTAEAGKTYSYYVRCLDENMHYIGTYDSDGKVITLQYLSGDSLEEPEACILESDDTESVEVPVNPVEETIEADEISADVCTPEVVLEDSTVSETADSGYLVEEITESGNGGETE